MRHVSFFLLLIALSFSQSAAAHTRSQSSSQWSVDQNTLSMIFAVDSRRVTQLAPVFEDSTDINSILKRHLGQTIHVEQDGIRCTADDLRIVGEGRAVRQAIAQFQCPQSFTDAPSQVRIGAFFPVSPTHIHLATVIYPSGEQVEFSLREGREVIGLDESAQPSGIFAFMFSGFSHVFSGLDHIAFVIALTLLATAPGVLFLSITGFTLGHSLTLAAASLGVLRPDPAIVESLIAYTIALTALEAGREFGVNRRISLSVFAVISGTLLVVFMPYPVNILIGILIFIHAWSMAQLRPSFARLILPATTFAFGLVHGAGFAGGFLEAGIAGKELIQPLIGFNIGVELAQIATLAGTFGVFIIAGSISGTLLKNLRFASSLFIFTMGVFWFTSRIAAG